MVSALARNFNAINNGQERSNLVKVVWPSPGPHILASLAPGPGWQQTSPTEALPWPTRPPRRCQPPRDREVRLTTAPK